MAILNIAMEFCSQFVKFWTCRVLIVIREMSLKEYYDEARPLSGFCPTHADFLRKCISNHETIKQAFKFQSDPSSNCFTIDV